MKKFKLPDEFLDLYKQRPVPWGPLGEITYARTYSRNEVWWQTVQRVVEGTYSWQKRHCKMNGLPWNEDQAIRSATKMFESIFTFKFTPPGRGLFMMGTDYVWDRRNGAPLNNCAFVSTKDIADDFSGPFVFLMDFSMLGVGVGFDTRGDGKFLVHKPRIGVPHVVEDSRRGWTSLVKRCLDSYRGVGTWPSNIDYSKLRAAGEPIKGFGGTSSGPGPLIQLIKDIQTILDPLVGQPITSRAIVDLGNAIGVCVVSGNVRRSAEVALGFPGDEEFLNLKSPEMLPQRPWAWASNNSLIYTNSEFNDYPVELTANNGEPGYLFLDNARAYGRMKDRPTYADKYAMGANPCLEQTLHNKELCCLVETYPANHPSLYEWIQTLKAAYLYAKTVTLIPTHDSQVNAVMGRNRRIGCSVSGVAQAINKFGYRNLMNALDEGYSFLRRLDEKYSNWLCTPRSIKMTSVKPSGTVSLLSGATPGMHYPHSEYYNRVIRFSSDSPYLDRLEDAGYNCIDISDKEPNTVAVYFPVKERNFSRGKTEVSMWEQLALASDLQYYWADNQVSVTVTFNKNEAKDIGNALRHYETKLKGVSFLPLEDHKYEHAPYQSITEKDYKQLTKNLKPLDLFGTKNEVVEKFCDGDSCTI